MFPRKKVFVLIFGSTLLFACNKETLIVDPRIAAINAQDPNKTIRIPM